MKYFYIFIYIPFVVLIDYMKILVSKGHVYYGGETIGILPKHHLLKR